MTTGLQSGTWEVRESAILSRMVLTDGDAGGFRVCDYSSHNITPDPVVLFVHDCSLDEQQTEASMELLREHLEQLLGQGGHIWVLLNKQDLLPTENPSAVALRIRDRFNKKLSEHAGTNLHWEILDLPGVNQQRCGKLLPVLDNVAAALGSKTRRLSPFPKVDDDQAYNPESSEALPQSVELPTGSEQRASMNQDKYHTMDDDTFWNLFLKADIKHWNHRSYLRAAYKVLLDALEQKQSVWEASEVFSHHIQRLGHSNKHIFLDKDNR